MSSRKPKSTKKLKTTHQKTIEPEHAEVQAAISPEAAFQSLIDPINIEDFFSRYWEKEPVVIVPGKSIKTPITNWFSKSLLTELLAEHPLHFVRDLQFCIFSEGKTKDLNKKGKVTQKEFNNLMEKMSATAQIHQPQRFVDPLWNILERLECLFGCLVGSNVYITPKGAQGLAPHYDDVEVFIFQLEGEKHWRLYKPPVELAREYKTNLPVEEIGKPTHEFVLKPGDVLYMPRGTIHQADTPADATSHSTHITISTYQRHSLGDYLLQTFPSLVEKGLKECLNLRRGLPTGLFLQNRSSNLSELLKTSLESLVNCVDDLKSSSAHGMVEDFMKSRLPPYHLDSQVFEEGPSGKQPTLVSKVRLAFPGHTAFAIGATQDDEEEEECSDEEEEELPESEEKFVFLYTSIRNSRNNHMISGQIEESNGFQNHQSSVLKFPLSCVEPLEQLIRAKEDTFTEVQSLGSISNDERLRLVTSLWAEHLLVVEV